MSIRHSSQRLAVLTHLAKVLDGEIATTKADLMAEMHEQDVQTAKPKLDDRDDPIATVSLTHRKPTASVSDAEALAAWVAEVAPTEVVETLTVREAVLRSIIEEADPLKVERTVRVRPAYVSALLAQAVAAGAPVTAAGEVIPGIDMRDGSTYVTTKITDGPAIETAWREGALASLLGQDEAPALPWSAS